MQIPDLPFSFFLLSSLLLLPHKNTPPPHTLSSSLVVPTLWYALIYYYYYFLIFFLNHYMYRIWHPRNYDCVTCSCVPINTNNDNKKDRHAEIPNLLNTLEYIWCVQIYLLEPAKTRRIQSTGKSRISLFFFPFFLFLSICFYFFKKLPFSPTF